MASIQQGFPSADSKFLEPNGTVAWPWFKLLLALFQKSGGVAPVVSGVSVQQNAAGQFVTVNSNGTQLAVLDSAIAGQIAQPQVLSTSPFTFQCPAGFDGVLVVESGQVELSRDGATFFICGLAGGAVPVRALDKVRVTWFETTPKVTFLPN